MDLYWLFFSFLEPIRIRFVAFWCEMATSSCHISVDTMLQNWYPKKTSISKQIWVKPIIGPSLMLGFWFSCWVCHHAYEFPITCVFQISCFISNRLFLPCFCFSLLFFWICWGFVVMLPNLPCEYFFILFFFVCCHVSDFAVVFCFWFFPNALRFQMYTIVCVCVRVCGFAAMLPILLLRVCSYRLLLGK